MHKDRWVGYIKDYDGGTLMECAINKNINYLNVPGMIQRQRAVSGFIFMSCSRSLIFFSGQFIYEQITLRAHSNIIYPGIEAFNSGIKITDPFEIPGICTCCCVVLIQSCAHGDVKPVEAGWTEKTSQKAILRGEGGLQGQLEKLMKAVKGHPSAWPFEQPVDTNEVADYLDVITDPIGKKQPP